MIKSQVSVAQGQPIMVVKMIKIGIQNLSARTTVLYLEFQTTGVSTAWQLHAISLGWPIYMSGT